MAYDYDLMSPQMKPMIDYMTGVYNPNYTSGHRSHEHNKAVGGASGSQHLDGNAVDLTTEGMSQAEIQALVMDLRAKFPGTGVGVYDGSIHFDQGGERNWGSDYTSNTAPEWLTGIVGGARTHGPDGAFGDRYASQQAGVGDNQQEEPQLPLWQMMQQNDEGQWGAEDEDGQWAKQDQGMMRIPGTGMSLNKAGIGRALSAFGAGIGGIG